MSTEETKAVLRRWYDEMWSRKDFDLIPELAGPLYVRHDMGGSRTVTAEEYRDQTRAIAAGWEIRELRYALVAEGDRVVSVGSWKVDGRQMDWVQCFRLEQGKLVETWLPAMGLETKWDDAVFASLETFESSPAS